MGVSAVLDLPKLPPQEIPRKTVFVGLLWVEVLVDEVEEGGGMGSEVGHTVGNASGDVEKLGSAVA